MTLHPGTESSLSFGLSRNAVDGQGKRLTWDVGGRQHWFESLLHIPATCLNPWAVYRLVLVRKIKCFIKHTSSFFCRVGEGDFCKLHPMKLEKVVLLGVLN